MKNLLLFALLLTPLFIFSQVDIKVEEQSLGMSKGTQPAFVVTIPQVDLKNIESNFKKYIKKGTKGKVEEISSEIILFGATNSKISPLVFDMYARITQSSNGVVVSAWLSEGEGFVSSQTAPSKAVAFKQYLRSFAVDEYKDAVKEEVKEEEKKLKDEQKKLEDFQKDEKKAESSIVSHRDEIASREKKIIEEQQNIATAKQNQRNQQTEVAKQEESLRKIQSKYNNIQ
jgi:hypothetical protein